jgi:hypothetical protein
MAKRFTAVIIIANIIMGLALYLSSQLILLNLSGGPNHEVITGFNIFSIYVAYAQGSSPVPTIVWSLPNVPFYVFILSLIVNAFFIIKLQRNKESK